MEIGIHNGTLAIFVALNVLGNAGLMFQVNYTVR